MLQVTQGRRVHFRASGSSGVFYEQCDMAFTYRTRSEEPQRLGRNAAADPPCFGAALLACFFFGVCGFQRTVCVFLSLPRYTHSSRYAHVSRDVPWYISFVPSSQLSRHSKVLERLVTSFATHPIPAQLWQLFRRVNIAHPPIKNELQLIDQSSFPSSDSFFFLLFLVTSP